MTYNLNVSFTRPDENDAKLYRVGAAIEATTISEAEARLRLQFAHLTIKSIDLFAVLNDSGDIVLAPVKTNRERLARVRVLAKLATGAAAADLTTTQRSQLRDLERAGIIRYDGQRWLRA